MSKRNNYKPQCAIDFAILNNVQMTKCIFDKYFDPVCHESYFNINNNKYKNQ